MNKHVKQMIQGKNIIGLGSRRTVYDLGNGTVLKVAKSIYGVANNKKEAWIYRIAPSEVKKHLGRILKHGDDYSWLIMKKYPSEFGNTRVNRRKLSDMRWMFRRHGMIPREIYGLRGPNYQNLRLNDKGIVKVIDYGNFKYSR